MSSFTDYLENKIIAHHFGGTNYNPSDYVRIGVSTTSISDDGTGATEPGGAYARIEASNNQSADGWSVPALVSTYHTVHLRRAITFAEATVDWGTITHFMVYDDGGTNMLGFGALDSSKTVASGDTAEFPSGSLEIRLY